MLVSTSPAPPLRQVFSDDTLWDRLRQEAADVLAREPVLAALILTTVINRETFEQAVIHRVALRLANGTVSTDLIVDAFTAALREDPEIGKAFRADIAAVVDRDPATARLIEPLLYYKGFHAIETHRLAHYLWNINQRDLAFYLQSRSSELFQTDIHPAARFGRGIFLDHATGFVVGATAIIEDNVSILQNVTLGGTGKESGDRHPKIKSGTMIGAGAKILGNIEVGPCARVAAGSVVLSPVPANSTVAGVPAKIVGTAGCPEPARDMNQILSKLAYDSFSYSI
ncbi:serine O-acetyltransferase [Methylovirgula ligni]|nr:serine O-acetyltransferase [Methylovirgula ligni]QAY97407.1 serine O-acetyltransferase [Methylovirgula ligni]